MGKIKTRVLPNIFKDNLWLTLLQGQNQNQGIAKYFQRQPVVNPPPRPNAAQIQGNLSEDEALARALQASLGNGQPQAAAGSGNSQALTQEEQDRMLALALAQGEQATGTTTGTRTS